MDQIAFDPATYRVRHKSRSGMPLRSMSFSLNPPPVAGESLLGLVARSIARNGFVDMRKAALFADFVNGTTTRIPSCGPEVGTRLAFVLKVPAAEVISRLYPVTQRSGREWVDFFGTPISASLLSASRRRVSPRALRLSPHHRAIHDVAAISFCPETLETLIDACPVCGTALAWKTTFGVEFCENCLDEEGAPTVDLREHPQPLVKVGDEEGLRMLPDLISPVTSIRAKALTRLDPAFNGVPVGEVFNVGILLARCLDSPLAAGPTIRFDQGSRCLPENLACAGRALISWESGFAIVADRLRAALEHRPGHYGLSKELGPVGRLPMGLYGNEMSSVLSRAISDDLRRTSLTISLPRAKSARDKSLVDCEQAAAMLGTDHKKVLLLVRRKLVDAKQAATRTMMLIPVDQIEAIRVVSQDMVEATTAAFTTGLPVHVLEMVADAGIVERASGPALALAGDRRHYRRASLQAFVERVTAKRVIGRVPRTCRKLTSELAKLPPGEKPWLAILSAMQEGGLRVFANTPDTKGIRGLFVDHADLRREYEAALLGADRTGIAPDVTLSYREAAVLLSISAPTVTWLVKAGVLRTNGSNERHITYAAIADFNATYMSTRELTKRLSANYATVRDHLARQGIVPVAALREGVRLVWRRDDIDRAYPSTLGQKTGDR